MVSKNISCIIFPPTICDFKEPASLNRVDIHTFDDSHNDICLYAGPCMVGNSSNMDLDSSAELASQDYPMVILPDNIKMEPICETAAVHRKLLMDVNIWTQDIDGNDISLHSGNCYVTYTDDDSGSFLEDSSDGVESDLFPELNSSEENTDLSSIDLNSIDLPSLVDYGTIDPCVSKLWFEDGMEYINTDSEDVLVEYLFPELYNLNQYDTDVQDYSMVNYESISTLSAISYEQDQNTFLSEDGQMYEETTVYFPQEDVGNEEIENSEEPDCTADIIIIEQDEMQLHLPEKINDTDGMTGNESRLSLGSDDVALKQLMSSNTRASARQQKTIMFSGTDALHGHTIQKMSYNDPYYECPADAKVVNKDVIDSPEEVPNRKKYQCAKCQQMFNQLSKLKEHMTNHGLPRYPTRSGNSKTHAEIQFTCQQCGKKLKCQEKYEVHCLGHGDPDRECSVCHNVLASKCSLRIHMKIHNRKHRCQFCTKSFDKEKTLKTHTAKSHRNETVKMDMPDELLDKDLIRNDMWIKKDVLKESSGSKLQAEKAAGKNPTGNTVVAKIKTQTEKEVVCKKGTEDENYIINKAVSHEMFLSKGKKHSRGRKQCNVCPKSFDRISDLKRHLIEHTLTSTLRKNPVNANGTLDIQCCLCKHSFSKIDKYKAHLREHAHLTIYKCTFCDKSFSDSSNFSKHKKIHGFPSFQCDLCQRKFNSRKMLEQHMLYHNENPPMHCNYCDKVYHFESTLKKHIKSAHTKESTSRYLCKPCGVYYNSLKAKWDHQWVDHCMRKMIVDCLVCGAKFRKYSELKRHCTDDHDMNIPLAKNIIKDAKPTRRHVRVEAGV